MDHQSFPASLTKENFWNNLFEKHPDGMKMFCEWIDAYKKQVDWSQLFFTPHSPLNRDIKYHDLPVAMQIGIFLQFVEETNIKHGTANPENKGLHKIIEAIERFIADYKHNFIDDE